MKTLLAIALVLMTALPCLATDDVSSNLSHLLQEGNLQKDHWYSFKPGKHYWVYQLKENKGIFISYTRIPNVPDLRPLVERNRFMRFIFNTNRNLSPLYGPALTALVATGGK